VSDATIEASKQLRHALSVHRLRTDDVDVLDTEIARLADEYAQLEEALMRCTGLVHTPSSDEATPRQVSVQLAGDHTWRDYEGSTVADCVLDAAMQEATDE